MTIEVQVRVVVVAVAEHAVSIEVLKVVQKLVVPVGRQETQKSVTVCVEHDARDVLVADDELSETSQPKMVAQVVGPKPVPVVMVDPSETVTWNVVVEEQTDADLVVQSSGGSDEYVGREFDPILQRMDGSVHGHPHSLIRDT